MSLEEDIKQAVEVLRKGGVILYPTDTIWGIGCDATNEEAVKRVYEIKQREDSKALICLVDSDNRLQRYVNDVPNVAWDLIECTTTPLTIIFDKAKNLASNLIAEDGSIAMRVTQEEV
ncbi:MAG: Sua5/YciO/YrdC/YwlC family protein, partial [Paraprevotella sp.]|nr:Sua5/YciO/YrdC/YwlC family protein [Paraprevotella sp.]